MTINLFARDPGAADALAALLPLIEGNKIFYAKDFAREVLDRSEISYCDFNEDVANTNLSPNDSDIVRSWLSQLDNASLLITGTSHFDDYTDRLIWNICQEQGIATVAVLDQWIRFRERFVGDGGPYRPDYILTPSEEIALTLNREGIPRKKALCIGAPHLAFVHKKAEEAFSRREATRAKLESMFESSFKHLVVYVSEPQRELSEKGLQYENVKYDEIEVYHFLKSGIESSELSDALLVAKLHPKEAGTNYHGLDSCLLRDEIDKFDLIAAADVMVGTKSMMLIEAAIFERNVLSIDLWDLEDEQLVTNSLGLSVRIQSKEDMILALNGISPVTLPSGKALEQLLPKNWQQTFRSFLEQIEQD